VRWALYLLLPLALIAGGDWYIARGQMTDNAYVEARKIGISTDVSGIVRQANAAVLILDGINNPGFSGGPVLYHTGADQVVLGVISGFRNEPGEIHSIEVPDVPTTAQTPDGKKSNKKKDVVDLNTGIIFAFMADVAIDAIKKNPMGSVEK